MLRRCRDLADEIARLRDNLKEEELRTISSPNMDGMPHGTSTGDAIPRQILRKDKFLSKLRTAERALKRSQNLARKALQHVKAPFRMFCEAYFIEAAAFDDAVAYARIDKRTGERYRAAVNGTE